MKAALVVVVRVTGVVLVALTAAHVAQDWKEWALLALGYIGVALVVYESNVATASRSAQPAMSVRAAPAPAPTPTATMADPPFAVRSDAISALCNMGIKKSEAMVRVDRALAMGATTLEDVIRAAVRKEEG